MLLHTCAQPHPASGKSTPAHQPSMLAVRLYGLSGACADYRCTGSRAVGRRSWTSCRSSQVQHRQKCSGVMSAHCEASPLLSAGATTVGSGGMGLTAADALGAGAPLTGDAWVARLRTPLEQAVAEEKAGYERGLAAGPKYPVWSLLNGYFAMCLPLITHCAGRLSQLCAIKWCRTAWHLLARVQSLAHHPGVRLPHVRELV
jgi:hypothetical protein